MNKLCVSVLVTLTCFKYLYILYQENGEATVYSRNVYGDLEYWTDVLKNKKTQS